MKKTLMSLIVMLAIAIAGLYWWLSPPAFSEACISTENEVVICAASSMARYSKSDPVTLEHPDFDLQTDNPNDVPTIRLSAARNESVAFQLVFQKTGKQAPNAIGVEVGEWQLDNSVNSSANKNSIESRLYQAHYHLVENGAYTWGPKSAVRPWPAEYPDALIPQQHGCFGDNTTVFQDIALPTKKHNNQAVWIDNYVPSDLDAGTYTSNVLINADNKTISVNVEITVFNVVLPNETSIDAIGEVYRSYGLEGASKSRDTESWQRMAQCYQQIAHQHRMVFMERTPDIPEGDALSDYIKTYQPQFDGSLFTEQYGYSGTGENTPVSLWRIPWPQEFNVKLENPLGEDDLARYTKMSEQWNSVVNNNSWNNTTFFAYVFDEVDGPDKHNTPKQERYDYLRMVHEQMDLLQKAIDTGTGNESVDLLWTSHSNPAIWADDPELDLSDKVRLWSPNASAADPTFLAERVKAGDTTWFYHSGHPAVGAHSVNASGIDMRTWGVIAARYDIQGTFMWAVNLGSDERPFAEPSYKPDDDRFGNGVVVYPGNQMDKIGFAKVPGPIPSMRLKSWRRGLQDAELFYLAESKDENAANTLIQSIVPVALADAKGKAKWAQNAADWIEFKKALLKIAAE